jgi:hypothetical protein
LNYNSDASGEAGNNVWKRNANIVWEGLGTEIWEWGANYSSGDREYDDENKSHSSRTEEEVDNYNYNSEYTRDALGYGYLNPDDFDPQDPESEDF